MATKSVIEIDILDDKFKSFQAAFDKYRDTLKSMPKEWQKTNEKITDIVKKQNDLNKSIKDGNVALKETANTTASIARNLASSALSIAKWVTLGALGGGFGLGAIAASASSNLRQAQGYGITTGQLTAAKTYLGTLIDPESILGSVAALKGQVGGSAILGRLTQGNLSQNPAEMLSGLIQGALRVYRGAGGNWDLAKQTLEPAGFTQQDMIRLNIQSAEQLKETLDAASNAAKRFDVSTADSVAWQKFWIQLKASGQLIETSFIKNLKVLTPALEQLSKSVADAIDGLLKNEDFQKWVDYASQKIHDFGEYLGSRKFQKDVKDFMSALSALATSVGKVARFFGLIKTTPEDRQQEAVDAANRQKNLPRGQQAVARIVSSQRNRGLAGLGSEQIALLGDLEKKYGLPTGTLKGILKAEHSGDLDVSSAGAMSRFQLLESTAKAYGVKNRTDFNENADAAARLMKDYLKQFGGSLGLAAEAYNWGSGNISGVMAGNGRQIPSQVITYGVTVTTSAGSDLNVSGAVNQGSQNTK